MKEFKMELARREYASDNRDAIAVDFKCLEDFAFTPGQYVRIRLIDPPIQDKHGDARIFNVASPSTEKRQISIVTRLRDSAFKKNLCDLPLGTKVLVSEALGDFTLKESNFGAVFLMGGTGVAPVVSMLHDVERGWWVHPLALFYSNKTIGRTVYKDTLDGFSCRGVVDKYVKTLTEVDLSSEGFRFGRIDEQMLLGNLHRDEIANSTFYITGPWGMGDSMTVVLKNLGVPDARIRVKEFDLKWLS